jgi:hypothetical protein
MAGVLGLLTKPQKKAMYLSDPKARELETAKEILAEVFRIRISEVEEMIQNRFEEAHISDAHISDAHISDARPEERGLWPQEFRLDM